MTTTENTERIIAAYMATVDIHDLTHNSFDSRVERVIRNAFISGMQAGLDLAQEISKEVHSK